MVKASKNPDSATQISAMAAFNLALPQDQAIKS